MLAGCFLLQKVYGRQPENILAINQLFHSVLGRYESSHVVRAFEIWLERGQEFPTPSDIVGIMKRKGRPPLSKEMYISLSRKEPESRSAEDWRYMRLYEAEQTEEHSEFVDEAKDAAVLAENNRLRLRVRELEGEVGKLNGLLHEARLSKGLEKPKSSVAEKVERTIREMRSSGAKEEDIVAFASQYGVEVPA